MRSLPPSIITAAELTDSSVAEPDPSAAGPWWPETPGGEAAWVTGTNYAAGSRVVRTTTHRVYFDTMGGLSTVAPEKDPVRWQDERPSNRWAWNDLRTSTQTLAASPYSHKVKPGAISDVEVRGLSNVDQVRVQVWDEPGGALVFDQTASTMFWPGDPWVSYYFDLPYQRWRVRFSGLPSIATCEVQLTLTSSDGNAIGVAMVAYGRFSDLGCAEMEFELKLRSYGSADADEYGTTTIKDGIVVRDLSGSVSVDAFSANRVVDFLELHRNRVCVWEVSEDTLFDYLSTVGVADVSIRPRSAMEAQLNLNVQGVG